MQIRIAVLIRENEGLSLLCYRENLIKELKALGATVLPFKENEQIPPECEIVWDPGMGRNRLPLVAFKNLNVPVLITLHGSATFNMKWREVYSGLFEAIRDQWLNVTAMKEWTWFRKKIAGAIAVSQYGADEAAQVYSLPSELVIPIYHGVDHTIFFPHNDATKPAAPYFLHVSAYQPKKNIDRLIFAYTKLSRSSRPKLIVVIPGYILPKSISRISGLIVINDVLSPLELSQLYSNALAFIFPSLHESFGLPIIEAMACGCPVITSFDTACVEVADNSALLVDPRSIQSISDAMYRIINEPDLRGQLRESGLARAKRFTWKESARIHLDVFRGALK